MSNIPNTILPAMDDESDDSSIQSKEINSKPSNTPKINPISNTLQQKDLTPSATNINNHNIPDEINLAEIKTDPKLINDEAKFPQQNAYNSLRKKVDLVKKPPSGLETSEIQKCLNVIELTHPSVLYHKPAKSLKTSYLGNNISMSFHPKKDILATTSENNSIRIFSLSQNFEIFSLKGHKLEITCLAFSPSGKFLASSSSDKTIKIWSIKEKSEKSTLSGASEIIHFISYSHNEKYIVSGCEKCEIDVWNVDQMSIEFYLEGHEEYITSVFFSPDDKYIASSSGDGLVILWSFNQRKIDFTFDGHKSDTYWVAFSPDGKMLASASLDQTIKIWSVVEKKEICELFGHDESVNMVGFNEDGKYLISASEDFTVKIWNLALRCVELVIGKYSKIYLAGCISPKGNYLALRGKNEYIEIIDLKEIFEQHIIKIHTREIFSSIFSPDNKFIISASDAEGVLVFNMEDKKTNRIHSSEVARPCLVSISHSGSILAIGCTTGTVGVYKFPESVKEGVLKGHAGKITGIAFTNDEKFLVSGSKDKLIKIWDLDTRKQIWDIQAHLSKVTSVRLSPDMKYISSSSWDKTVKIWNYAERREEYKITSFTDKVLSLSFSPSGLYLSAGCRDTVIRIWNMESRCLEFCLNAHDSKITSVNFSPDSLFLASSSNDGSIKVWNIQEKRLEYKPSSNNEDFTSVCFSPNGKYLMACSWQSNITLWKIGEKFEIDMQNKGIERKVEIFDRGFNICLTVNKSKEVKVFRIKDKEMLIKICKNVNQILCASFSEDGKFLAWAKIQFIEVVEIEFKKKEAMLVESHTKPVCLGFSKDNMLLACAFQDKSIEISDLKSKNIKAIIKTGLSDVYHIIFSPQNNYLAVLCGNYNITIWDINSNSLCMSITGETNDPKYIDFNSDSLLFASISKDKSQIHIFNLITQTKILTSLSFQSELSTLTFLPNNNLQITESNNITIILSPQGDPLSLIPFFPTLNLYSIPEKRANPFISFYGTLEKLSIEKYQMISNWNTVISNNNYTALHLVAFKGDNNAIKNALGGNDEVMIKADRFGRSPLFYSIANQHQAITDALLKYIVKISYDKRIEWSQNKMECFYAIRNELVDVIRNSSQELGVFLRTCLDDRSSMPVFGFAPVSVKFGVPDEPSFDDFLVKNPFRNEPLKLHCSWFELPCNLGSASSIQLLKSFLESKNKDIYNSHLIKSFIKHRWHYIWPWVMVNSLLLWSNLILIIIVLGSIENTPNIEAYILIAINIIFLIWESLQIITFKFQYFSYGLNFIDIPRVLFTLIWVICWLNSLKHTAADWFMVLLNIISGITGFRAFDRTRYYIRLIIESLKSISFFLAIFVYTTLSFGILSIAARSSLNVNFDKLWITIFGLVIGETSDLMPNDFNYMYATFVMAIVINIILMLNMIISILGDSFDEFQILANYYDYSEMAELILENEQIRSLFSQDDKRKYMHICENFYMNQDNIWMGKVNDVRLCIRYSEESLKKEIDFKYASSERKFGEIQEKIDILESKMNDKIDGVEMKINMILDLLKKDKA